MINLLSLEDQRQLRAARTNSLLLRYVVLLGIILLFLIVEMGGAYFVLSNTNSASQQQIDSNNAKTASYADTKLKFTNFSRDLSTAKYILGQQVPYTTILLKLAATLPENTTLDSIEINPATFGTPSTLTVNTGSYEQAVNVKTTFQQSDIFTDVNFVSLARVDNTPPRFIATYNVTYSKGLLKQ